MKTEVSVIGLGAMGGVLARTLLAGGKRVTVWNRSEAKSASLAAEGAAIASSAAAAIEASPITILCLTDAPAALEVLQGGDAAFPARTIANLTSAGLDVAEALGRRVTDAGGRYLTGSIMAYPRDIGREDTALLYSGDAEAFSTHRELLALLGGRPLFVGEDWAQAKRLSWPLYVQFFTAVAGFFEGVALAQRLGINPQDYAHWVTSTLGSFYASHVGDLARRLEERDFKADQASLDIEIHAADSLVGLLESRGIPAFASRAYQTYIHRAQDAGFHDLGVAAAADLVCRGRPEA